MVDNKVILSEVFFYSNKRQYLPVVGYRPDALLEGQNPDEYWGITFMDCSISEFDTWSTAKIKFTFQNSHYDQVKEGQMFQIMEGRNAVGVGKVIRVVNDKDQ